MNPKGRFRAKAEYIRIVESNDDETLQELLVWLRKGVHWSAAERGHLFPRTFCCFVNFVKCLREQEETTMMMVDGEGPQLWSWCVRSQLRLLLPHL